LRFAVLALAALALPAAALAQAASLYDEAVTARRAGNNERARVLLEQVVAAEPRNSDAHVQLGFAMLALGRLADAERTFRQALAIAPDYQDARIGLARVAQRRGDRAAALAELEAIDPFNREAGALRAELQRGEERAGPQPRNSLDIDLAYSDLEGGRPDWKEGSIRLRHQATPATAIGAGLEVFRRFGLTDVYGELRLDQQLSDAATVYVSLGGTADADFRPEWQIGAGGSVRVAPGPNPTVLTLDARQAHFRSGDIQTLNPGVEHYFGGGRAWLAVRWINIFDEDGDHESGWLARGDLQMNRKVRLFLGAADAPDTSEGVVTETFSLFGGLVYDLDQRRTVRVSLAHEDREGGGDRLQLSLGMGVRF
jgi:YaiO family outer membrane protein